jgi:hypothetical protein
LSKKSSEISRERKVLAISTGNRTSPKITSDL